MRAKGPVHMSSLASASAAATALSREVVPEAINKRLKKIRVGPRKNERGVRDEVDCQVAAW